MYMIYGIENYVSSDKMNIFQELSYMTIKVD